MTVVGFTGTRKSMSAGQLKTVRKILEGMQLLVKDQSISNVSVVHGDCIGADEEFDGIASSLGIERQIYPCTLEDQRAHCENLGAKVKQKSKTPLERNKDIVKSSNIVIATPSSNVEEQRSGTWATIRFARKTKAMLIIVFPDGKTAKENIWI